MENEKPSFDFKRFEEEALAQLRSGKPLEGKEGVLAPLIKRLVEASLEGEMKAHLSDARGVNRRNGKGSKQVKTAFGRDQYAQRPSGKL
jgi:transposase-like protein